MSHTAFVTQAGCKDIAASKDDLLAEIDLASEILQKLRQKVEVTFQAKQVEAGAHTSAASTVSELGSQGNWIGKMKYDWLRDSLVLPSGVPHQVPMRFVEVLHLLLDKDPMNRKAKRWFAPVAEIALTYRTSTIREACPTITKKDIQDRLQTLRDDTRALKQHAHQCKRGLARWARGLGIDGDLLLVCDRRQGVYRLGKGWHQKSPVINRSEVYAAKEFNDSVLHGEWNTQPGSTEDVGDSDDQGNGHDDATDPVDGSGGEDS